MENDVFGWLKMYSSYVYFKKKFNRANKIIFSVGISKMYNRCKEIATVVEKTVVEKIGPL